MSGLSHWGLDPVLQQRSPIVVQRPGPWYLFNPRGEHGPPFSSYHEAWQAGYDLFLEAGGLLTYSEWKAKLRNLGFYAWTEPHK